MTANRLSDGILISIYEGEFTDCFPIDDKVPLTEEGLNACR